MSTSSKNQTINIQAAAQRRPRNPDSLFPRPAGPWVKRRHASHSLEFQRMKRRARHKFRTWGPYQPANLLRSLHLQNYVVGDSEFSTFVGQLPAKVTLSRDTKIGDVVPALSQSAGWGVFLHMQRMIPPWHFNLGLVARLTFVLASFLTFILDILSDKNSDIISGIYSDDFRRMFCPTFWQIF